MTTVHTMLIVAASVGTLSLVGCAQMGQKEAGGTLVGAGTGGLIGSQFGSGSGKLVTTGIGVLLGGLLGSDVGRSLDRADRSAMESTTQQTLEKAPTGQASSWRNPDTGNYGTVTPMRPYQGPEGSYCREFQQTVTVAGQTQHAYGTACRQADGSWKIVS